ncbi:MAG: hypothetical protein PXX73_06770 [Sideroxydans sp.]|nr:hypothetical protein [Sideroxydans sp.]
MAKSEESEVLIPWLKAISLDHKRAPPSVHLAIDRLIQVISSNRIAIADWNRSGSVWNRKSILRCIVDFFDPLLLEVIPVDSLVWIQLRLEGAPLPLSTHLKSKVNIVKFADNLKRAIQVLEGDSSISGEDWKIIVIQGESLSAVAAILYAISCTLPNETPHWCSACFRRANGFRKYCRLHKPSDVTANDTAYRKAIKLQKSLPQEVLCAWAAYRFNRTHLEESFELISGVEDETSFYFSKGVVTSSLLKSVVEKTMVLPWYVVSQEWDDLLNDFQHVSSLLARSPVDFKGWNEFSAYLLKVLNDIDEETTHPFWILNIICCADEWLKAEKEAVDGRKNRYL